MVGAALSAAAATGRRGAGVVNKSQPNNKQQQATNANGQTTVVKELSVYVGAPSIPPTLTLPKDIDIKKSSSLESPLPPLIAGLNSAARHSTAPPLAMASIPSTMKAVVVEKTGGLGALEYKEQPLPTVSPGQALIKNEF